MANRPKHHDPIRRKVVATLSEVLREERARMRLSQESVAHLAEIDRSHMGEIERGVADTTITMVFKISGALQLRPSQLIGLLEKRFEVRQTPASRRKQLLG
jgi:transcriptional regulator with XRE-family HTH domain